MHLKKASSSSNFLIVELSWKESLYVCKSSHRFLFYPSAKSRKMRDFLEMYSINFPPSSIFVVQWYLPNDSAEYLKYHNLRNHVYFVPKAKPLHDSIACAPEWSIGIVKRSKGNRTDESDAITPDEKFTLYIDVDRE